MHPLTVGHPTPTGEGMVPVDVFTYVSPPRTPSVRNSHSVGATPPMGDPISPLKLHLSPVFSPSPSPIREVLRTPEFRPCMPTRWSIACLLPAPP